MEGITWEVAWTTTGHVTLLSRAEGLVEGHSFPPRLLAAGPSLLSQHIGWLWSLGE
jgi:hypothetical protein